jgi:hypothetical protein
VVDLPYSFPTTVFLRTPNSEHHCLHLHKALATGLFGAILAAEQDSRATHRMSDAPTSNNPTGSTTRRQILPVPTYTVPYWRTQLHAIDSHRSSETLPEQCDIAIIGSGMAGVTTAYHLCKQSKMQGREPSIVMLEAREVCSGATGRNGVSTRINERTDTKATFTHVCIGPLQSPSPYSDEMAQTTRPRNYG